MRHVIVNLFLETNDINSNYKNIIPSQIHSTAKSIFENIQ